MGNNQLIPILLVARQQLLHVADLIVNCLARETVGFGNITAGCLGVNRPVNIIACDNTQRADCEHCNNQNNYLFFLHNYVFLFLDLFFWS